MKKIIILSVCSFISLFGATVVAAEEPRQINNVDEFFFVVGDQQTNKEVEAVVAGGKAIEVKATGVGGPWQAGALALVTGDIHAGDEIVINANVRSKTPSGKPGKIIVRLETAKEPWTTIYEQTVEVREPWDVTQISFSLDKDVSAKTAQITLHLNSMEQVIYLGPLVVLNKGNPKKNN